MKKIILKENGKQIFNGDTITKAEEIICSCGKICIVHKVTVSEDTINDLLEKGIIEIKDDEGVSFVAIVAKMAKRKKWSIEDTLDFLEEVHSINTAAVLDILFKEIAIELDKKYEDHISKSDIIYSICTLNGKILKINKSKIVNYKSFAAFRTIEDAKIACEVLSPILEELYGKGE